MQFKSAWRTLEGVMPFQVSTRPALHIGAVRVSVFINPSFQILQFGHSIIY
jgi:hypothetical protein